jgi:hypothetical protein
VKDLPLCNNPCNDPESERDQCPTTGGEKGTLSHMLGASEDADIDVFGRNMAVYHTSDDNLEDVSWWSLESMRRPDRWDGNAIGNFGHHFSCRAKSWG